ncbi:MAG: HAMP domain-containing histidine kinase [Chloroflexi bacterium]|nr:MAG: HAMP domain-containing histidine kinase [Chloroflexota bacterium]TMG60432.1 MAG: HAMP domain-containing histidine kinase [Chloroflexota bacterium]
MPRSIATRLFLSYIAVVVVGLAVAAVAISGLLLRYEDDQTRVHLEELSAPFLTAIQTGVRAGQQPREIVDALTEQAHAANTRLLITTAARRVVIDSDGRLVGSILPQPSASNIGEFTESPDQWLFVRQQLRQAAAGGVGLGFIVVARPRAVLTDTLRALLPSLALSGLVALAFAVLVAALLARTITRPLRDLVGGVRRFAGGDYGTRVPLAGPSEVAEMGTAFNEMASEIQRSRGSEQAFLADISHELRTPLTSIQGFAQAIVEGEARGDAVSHVAEIIHREARRLVRMVEGLLQVARLESGGQSMAREDVVPARLLESAVAALEVQAKTAGVSFDVEGAEALPSLRGDPDKLAQLFLNVLDNAMKHSPRGTTVHVRGSRDDGAVVVRVRDAGSGLPQGAQTRLFQRFYRGENAQRDGAGLGLAIAQAIAQAHGGSIRASNVDGGGAEFTVRLPIART